MANNDEKERPFRTIGLFYELLTKALWYLNDHETGANILFDGNPLKQFTYHYLENMVEITNLRTALDQIRLITEQGQGSNLYSATGELNKTSHFLKFIEIYTGCDVNISNLYTNNKRYALYTFIRNKTRFSEFPNYTNVQWTKNEHANVKNLVED